MLARQDTLRTHSSSGARDGVTRCSASITLKPLHHDGNGLRKAAQMDAASKIALAKDAMG
jgi:hypothetical protein